MKKFIKKLNEFLPQSMQMRDPDTEEDVEIEIGTEEEIKREREFDPFPDTAPKAITENDLLDKFKQVLMELDETEGLENLPEYKEIITAVFGGPGTKEEEEVEIGTEEEIEIERGREFDPFPDTAPKAMFKESFNIKSFSQFVNESDNPSFRNNPAFSKEYQEGWAEAIRQNVQELDQAILARPAFSRMQVPQMVQIMGIIQNGLKEELEELAEKIVRKFYGAVLTGVELDINLEQAPEDIVSGLDKADPQPLERIKDFRVLGEIHRRKTGQMLQQAEAKATKQLFKLAATELIEVLSQNPNADQIEQRLSRFGINLQALDISLGQLYVLLLSQVGDMSDRMDLSMSVRQMLPFWKASNNPAGIVKVKWKSGKEDDEDKEEAAKKILKDLENGKTPDKNKVDKFFGKDRVVITAYGNDFGMLLHETIKGIWQMFVNSALPKDEETRSLVLQNTDNIFNEIEDLKFGNRFRKNFNEFIKIRFDRERTNIPNFKERLFNRMFREKNPYTYLKMILAILNKNYSPKGMTKIDNHAMDIARQESEYQEKLRIQRLNKSLKSSQFKIPETPSIEPPMQSSGNLEDLSVAELNQRLRDAIEEEDYILADRINKIIRGKNTNESRRFFGRGFNRYHR